MDSSSPPHALPADPVPPAAADPADQQAISYAVQDLADRLTSLEGEAARRFEAMRGAFADLRHEVRNGAQPIVRDDQRRRLVEFLGYEPTLSQQLDLFKAFAEWHATGPALTNDSSARYKTKSGAPVSFGWASLAQVIQVGQTAAPFGLFSVTRTELDDTGHPIVTGYLIHISGGAIGGGPIPFFVDDDSERPGQAHAGGLTSARRLALKLVMGLDEPKAEDVAAGAAASTSSTARPRSGPALADAPRRRADSPERHDRTSPAVPSSAKGPPPGWLSRDQRRALEAELSDPSITSQRIQEIEAVLQAAANSVRSTLPPSAGGGEA